MLTEERSERIVWENLEKLETGQSEVFRTQNKQDRAKGFFQWDSERKTGTVRPGKGEERQDTSEKLSRSRDCCR